MAKWGLRAFGLLCLWALCAGPATADLASADLAYEEGDFSSAYEAYYRLASDGWTQAQIRLGDMHRDGSGTIRDEREALRWYEHAAKQGSVDGQFALARLYRESQGPLADDALAYVWFNLAAAQGNTEAAKLRDIVVAALSRQERERAAELAREYHQRFVMPLRPGNHSGSVAVPAAPADETQLREAYEELKQRYRRLARDRANPSSRDVVEIAYARRGGAKQIWIKPPTEDLRRTVELAELHRIMALLQDHYGDSLYVKVVIPANSGLAYEEARDFRENLLQKYDADFRLARREQTRIPSQ